MDKNLITIVKEYEEEYLAFLQKMVELESPTDKKVLVDKVVDLVENFLVGLDVRVTRISQEKYGDNLLAEWGEGDEEILFIGHVDTVWEQGTLQSFPFSIEGDVIRGPGSYDMKCGVMQALFALKIMKEHELTSRYKIVLLINSDEEIGSPGSRELIEKVAQGSKYAVVGEGAILPDGILKIERSGVGFFSMKIDGKAAHAGVNPEDGASAIHEFAKQVQYLESLADPMKGSLINVGVVNGGTRANVVADHLTAEIDIRVKTAEEAKRIENSMKQIAPFDKRINVTVGGELNRPPMEKTAKNNELFKKVIELGAELGVKIEGTGTGGMSDANLTSAMGIATIDGLGAVGGGGHSHDEHLLKSYIPERTALLIKVFTELDE